MNCPTDNQPFTQAQATDKARRASRRYSTGFAAYHCPECGAWHFGHTMRRAKPIRIIHRVHEMRGTA